jgi:hypothetical protein
VFQGNGAVAYRELPYQAEEVHGKEEQMKHPSDAELALHAGGDLGWIRQKLTARHLKNCGSCQATVVEFSELRPDAREFQDPEWARRASEMSANIRLGLEAGECVSMKASARPWNSSWGTTSWGAGLRDVTWPRLGLASLVLVALAGVGYMLQHPGIGMNVPGFNLPVLSSNAAAAGTVMEASENGLQVQEAGQTLRLLNTSGNAVSRSVGSRGELGARYLDSNGYVTISQVYGQ